MWVGFIYYKAEPEGLCYLSASDTHSGAELRGDNVLLEPITMLIKHICNKIYSNDSMSSQSQVAELPFSPLKGVRECLHSLVC